MTGLWLVSYIMLWLLFLSIAIVQISVLRNLGIIYQRIERRFPLPTGLVAGDPLPEVTLTTLDGVQVQISRFLRGAKSAIVIVSPTCSGCFGLLKKINAGDHMAEDSSVIPETTVVVSIRDLPGTIKMIQEINLSHSYPVLVDTETTLEKIWKVRATPVILEVGDDLKVIRQTVFPEPSSAN